MRLYLNLVILALAFSAPAFAGDFFQNAGNNDPTYGGFFQKSGISPPSSDIFDNGGGHVPTGVRGKGAASCPSFVTEGHVVGKVTGSCGICEWTCGPQMCGSPMYVTTIDGSEFGGGRPNMNIQDAQYYLALAIGQGQCQ
ncbi:MAG: hypothetical protein ACXWQO_02410 [Bdellovibrionota bacterium]